MIPQPITKQKGMTVIELSLTLALMISFSSIVFFSVKGIANWKLASLAGEELRAVYLAQKNFLADHPTTNVADLADSDLIPYLPGNRESIVRVESLEGDLLDINFNTIPPTLMGGSSVYDPSGKDNDSLWDAGVR